MSVTTTTTEANQKVRIVCQHCGSTDVTRDGLLSWSIPDQRWEMAGELDNSDCNDCFESDCLVEEVMTDEDYAKEMAFLSLAPKVVETTLVPWQAVCGEELGLTEAQKQPVQVKAEFKEQVISLTFTMAGGQIGAAAFEVRDGMLRMLPYPGGNNDASFLPDPQDANVAVLAIAAEHLLDAPAKTEEG